MSSNKSFKLKFLVYILGLSTTTLLATGETLAKEEDNGTKYVQPISLVFKEKQGEFLALEKTFQALEKKFKKTTDDISKLKKGLEELSKNNSETIPEEDLVKISEKIQKLEADQRKLGEEVTKLKNKYDSLNDNYPLKSDGDGDGDGDGEAGDAGDEPENPNHTNFWNDVLDVEGEKGIDIDDEKKIEEAKKTAAELLKKLNDGVDEITKSQPDLASEVDKAVTKFDTTLASVNEDLKEAVANLSNAAGNDAQPTYRIGTLYADLQSVASSQATDLNRKFFRFSSDYNLAPTTGVILLGATKGKFDTSIHGVDIVENKTTVKTPSFDFNDKDEIEKTYSTTEVAKKSYNYGVLSGKAVTRERHALIGFKTSVDEYNLGLGYSFIHGKVKAGNPSAYLANFADATYHADNFLVSLGRGYGDRYFTLGLFFSNFKYEVTHSTPELSPLDYNFSAQQSKFNARMFGLDLSGAYKLHESEEHLWTVDANLMLAKYSADAISETSLQTGKDALTADQKMLAFKYKAHSGLIGNISLGTEYRYVYDIHTFTARLEANYRFANANKFKVELENNLAEAYSITKNFSARIGLGYSLEFIKDWKLKLSGALGIGTIKEKSWQLGLEAKF